SEILLDRERCVLCARCTRFADQIAGDPFIELFDRGATEQVGVYRGDEFAGTELGLTDISGDSVDAAELDEPFNSYFSGNTIQICPVGALTSATYRFRARPFDLVSTPSVCEHCASGCAQRTDWRRNRVMRRLAGDDPEVNEEWNCDKGRFAFAYPATQGRITTPLIRDTSGDLVPTSWSEALTVAAEGLREARDAAGVGVLTGGRLTVEDAYAYSVFTRAVLGSNDIDFRSRPHSYSETNFLADHVAGVTPATGGLTYSDLDTAPTVLLVSFEPEEESPIVFLRLRKASRRPDTTATHVYSVAPLASSGLEKLSGTLIETAPGAETAVLNALVAGNGQLAHASAGLRRSGAVILVGERAAIVPGALDAAAALAQATGARLAWVPRRAGDRGALEAGALPNLLPGARLVSNTESRAQLEQIWGVQPGTIPSDPGRDAAQILAAAADGELDALLIGGVDIDDLADPHAAAQALERVGFLVSLELRHSSVTAHADVVLPVAAAVEKAGTYYSWEGRQRPFEQTLRDSGTLTDARILDALAAELDVELRMADLESLRESYARCCAGSAQRASDRSAQLPSAAPVRSDQLQRAQLKPGEAILATWRHLLDAGTLQLGEPHLAGT
ncbi:MAG: NADH-quinone oxidoreductase subunit G, partial [Mycobacteriales bacterium]